MKLLKKLQLLFLFVSLTSQAQLPEFNLQLSSTNETCPGNGSITISVTNVAASASVLYKIYKLPEAITPLSIQTGTTVSNLTAGLYKVVAIQAIGSQTNTQEQNINIIDAIVPFNFTIASSHLNCSTGAKLTVTVTSGTASAYEIISGPVIRPVQSSNVFTNLPSGTYNVRAYDICGSAKVKTFTISVNNTVLSISDVYYPDSLATVCDHIRVNHVIRPSTGSISYPLNIRHRLNVMNMSGDEIELNQVYAAGSPDSLVVSALVPRYQSGFYTYDLKVSDNCNNTYVKNDNIVSSDIKLVLDSSVLNCGERLLQVSATGHKAPFTIEFLSAPAGFLAEQFNSQGQGLFVQDTVSYGGEGNPVPFGNYTVKLTDACGRTIQDTINVVFEPLEPIVEAANNGCLSPLGSIHITIPGQQLVNASIVSAPAAAQFASQQTVNDVSSYINYLGELSLTNIPSGAYVIALTDNCGFIYNVDVLVPEFIPITFNIRTLPSCQPSIGSIKAKSNRGPLATAHIIDAPVAFPYSLPFNGAPQINSAGDFYMHGLPEGNYTMKVTDLCGVEKVMSVLVQGYHAPANGFVYEPYCDSFSIKVTDTSNGLEGATYFLQKYFPEYESWGHPQTGVLYTEGTIPGTGTGIRLQNNVYRHNFSYNGNFRIIKKFETFWESSGNNMCISVFAEFKYDDVLSLRNAYTLECTGNPNDVYLDATGQITSYRITQKNGVGYLFDNGNNNIFNNLEPATYVFEIEDLCGNKLVKEFNLRELPSLAEASQPADMHLCQSEDESGVPVFQLTDQDEAILGTLHSAMYTVSYHLTQQDADLNLNPLPEYYTAVQNSQAIYVRLVHNEIPICHGTTSFRLVTGQYANPAITALGSLCNNEMLALTAPQGFNSYLWSTGETSRTIFVSEPGIYKLITEKIFEGLSCEGYSEIVISESSAPVITDIESYDWTYDQNKIVIHVEGTGDYVYSLNGIDFQESNVFEGLENGFYNVIVKDKNGCGEAVEEVVLLNYPKFFTPNGDGYHDKWRIKFAMYEPNLTVVIFDRFGKIISSFGAASEGWDGTYNGAQLPSTDYWFVVKREDGRELKGHFAMLR